MLNFFINSDNIYLFNMPSSIKTFLIEIFTNNLMDILYLFFKFFSPFHKLFLIKKDLVKRKLKSRLYLYKSGKITLNSFVSSLICYKSLLNKNHFFIKK